MIEGEGIEGARVELGLWRSEECIERKWEVE